MSEQTHLSELDSVEDYNSAPVGTLIHDHPDGLYCYRGRARVLHRSRWR